jgi:uncharacterized protein YwgA
MDIKKAILEDLSEVKRNLLLLLSSNSNEPINGKLWYQKELFLVSKNNKKLEEEANFEPYFWGAHSELVDTEMDELIQLGVVKKIGSKYLLTDIGRDIAHTVLKKTSKSEKELIEDVKDFLNSLTKDELLLFIYVSYPNMCEDAVELKNLLPKRKEIAIRMYRKRKISVGKASEIAGVSVSEMIKELQERKIYRVEEDEGF